MNTFIIKNSFQLNYYISYFGSLLKEEWTHGFSNYEKKCQEDEDYNEFVSNECQKFMDNKEIDIKTFLTLFNCKKRDFRSKNKTRNKKHKITYAIPPNQPLKIEYNDKKMYVILVEKGLPVDGHPFPILYQELYIKNNLSENEMIELYSKAQEYHEKNISDEFSHLEDKIRVSVFEEGYWETLNYKPYRSFDTICLPKKQLNKIITDLKNFMDPKTEERYSKLGLPFKRNYLLEGLPGTGKSSLIHAIASELNYDICVLTFHAKIDDVTMMKALRNIEDKNILVLEDIDSLFIERKKSDNHKNRISFSGLLNCLDGLAHKHGLITIMTTNYKMNLDSALIRPGRIDYMMNFDFANKEQIETMFYNFMSLNKSSDKENYFSQFYSAFKDLSIKITTSLLQQYLYIYIDKPKEAIDNIFDLKELHQKSFDKNADKQLYI